MQRNRVNLILLGLVCVMGLGVFLSEKQRQKSLEVERVIEMKAADVFGMNIHTVKGDFELKKMDGQWEIMAPYRAKVEIQKVAETLETLERWPVLKVVEESPNTEQLKEFGLDQPMLTASLQTLDQVYVLHVGVKVPLSPFYYAQIKGNPRVLLVPRDDVITIFDEVGAYQDLRLFPVTFENWESLEWTTINGPIALKKNADIWSIVEPWSYPADQEAMESFLARLSALKVEPVGKLSEVGDVAETSQVIRYRAGGQDYSIDVGLLDPENKRYPVRIVSSGQTQYVLESAFQTLEVDAYSFKSKDLFPLDVDSIHRIDLSRLGHGAWTALKDEGVWRISADQNVYHEVNHKFHVFLQIFENSMIQEHVERKSHIFKGEATMKANIEWIDGQKKSYEFYHRQGQWILHDDGHSLVMNDAAFESWNAPAQELMEQNFQEPAQ